MKFYLVRIKPGVTHGARNQYKPGDELVFDETEVAAFADKAVVLHEIVDAPQPDAQPEPEPDFDLAKATADEVITAVANGIITQAAALEAENCRSRPRKTVLEALSEA